MSWVWMVTVSLCLSAWGCLVEPRDDGVARVQLQVTLDLPPFLGTRAEASREGFKKKPSRVKLTEKPVVAMVEVEAGDLTAPVADRYAGDPGEDEAVELGLEVTSGDNRELSLVVFYWDGDVVHTYKTLESGLTLESGDQTLELEPEEAENWTLDGVLEVDETGPLPVGVVVEDVGARAEFPECLVEEGPQGFDFTVPRMPVGRFFYLRVHWDDGSWSEPLYFCPLFFGQPTHQQRTINLREESC